MSKPIYVTQSFLPPIEEYEKYLRQIWGSKVLTNQGPLLHLFENELKDYLAVDYFHFVTNGTLALQLALRAVDIKPGDEIITTPFSYVATTSAILWELCTPVFVDINPENYNINPELIEAAITPKTKAILAVHVFGIPCDTEAIEKIAHKHHLKVIYDGAHAFGVKYKDKPLLSYGDISICSFHATKIFHTIEGGAIITNNIEISEKIELQKRFGHNGDDHILLGINAKASEFQAAMGLSIFPYVDHIIQERKKISSLYTENLNKSKFKFGTKLGDTEFNYAYFPVLCASHDDCKKVISVLESNSIYPRRYFYPSLNKLPYVDDATCVVSEDIASRIICLPLYVGLSEKEVIKITELMNLA